MKKSLLLTFAILFTIALPAFAASYADKTEDIQSDTQAIRKDDTALAHDKQNLKANRAAKATHKANDEWGQQAVDSAKIGANHTAIEEKKTEKDIDQRILTHDEQK